ncbi:MAG: FixH family protein [Deltaproteobacteria bacterium]|nr:FixH family protein [Deltaproteobacteria bacterium]
MKRWSWLVVLLVVLVAGTVLAKENTVQKKAGDYSVEIKMDKDTPVVGSNNVEIVIKDKTGKAVTDAKVLVTASMPAMPGMPAMENKADAKLDGGKYKAKIDLSMGGSWNMSVRITQGGKTATAKWTVDAR